jgi:outer membrane biosynthesis protein TonB
MAQVFSFFQQLKHAIKRKTVVFSLATLLLHVLFFESATWTNWKPQVLQASNSSIQVNLRPATEPASNPNPSTQATVTTKALPKPAPPKKVKSSPKPKAQEPLPEPVTTTDIKPEEKPAELTPPPEEAPAVTTVAEEKNLTKLITQVPSSIEMRLDVTHTKVNDTPTRGVATLSWQVYNNRYKLQLEVGVNLIITTLNLYTLSSEGDIGPYGLMPGTSTDERKTKASTAIHFNHFAKTITFSASNKTVPMQDGVQDAASLLLQLAAIGNGQAAQFISGKEFTIQVAEGRDAAEFIFQVVDEEEIDSKLVAGSDKLKTVHIVRPPRPGIYNSRLDIWLAPSLSWYPVQIRNTESNGTVTNQIVTEIKKRVVADDK